MAGHANMNMHDSGRAQHGGAKRPQAAAGMGEVRPSALASFPFAAAGERRWFAFVCGTLRELVHPLL